MIASPGGADAGTAPADRRLPDGAVHCWIPEEQPEWLARRLMAFIAAN
jgi:hypothetical protein